MRLRSLPFVVVLALAFGAVGCGALHHEATGDHKVAGARKQVCTRGSYEPLLSPDVAYAAVVKSRADAAHRPGGRVFARFGKRNGNRLPMIFGVLGARVNGSCSATWFQVKLPLRPNGVTGWVRASDVSAAPVHTRIVVDISARRLTLYRDGRPVLGTAVAVGAPATPTPIGRFYVNQRLRPTDPNGPYGPYAVGVSAFSNVLTGWTEGGPIGIHGTDEPSSIGHNVSNGCIRLPNPTIERLFRQVLSGTPVIIHP